jgi:hypothetical protein
MKHPVVPHCLLSVCLPGHLKAEHTFKMKNNSNLFNKTHIRKKNNGVSGQI